MSPENQPFEKEFHLNHPPPCFFLSRQFSVFVGRIYIYIFFFSSFSPEVLLISNRTCGYAWGSALNLYHYVPPTYGLYIYMASMGAYLGNKLRLNCTLSRVGPTFSL